MAVQVNPIIARKGRFMESFKIRDTANMEAFMERAEQMLRDSGVKGKRIVYTKIPRWSASRKFDMWQVYVIPEGLMRAEDEKINPRYRLKDYPST